MFVSSILAISSCSSTTKENTNLSDIASPSLKTAAIDAENRKSYDEATNYWLSYYKEDPKDEKRLINLAKSMRYAGKMDNAVHIIELYTKENGEKDLVLIELAKSKIANNNANDAIKILEKSIKLNNKNWDSYSTLGIAYDYIGKYKDAQKNYIKAMNIAPFEDSISNNMALSLASSGKIDKAIELLEKMIRTRKSNIQMKQNLAFLKALKGDIETSENLAKELPSSMAEHNMEIYRLLSKK